MGGVAAMSDRINRPMHDPNRIITAAELTERLRRWESLAEREQVYNGNQAVLDLVDQVKAYLRGHLALFAEQPTVAQIKAEALREAATTIARVADQGADGEASPYETADWLQRRAAAIEWADRTERGES